MSSGTSSVLGLIASRARAATSPAKSPAAPTPFGGGRVTGGGSVLTGEACAVGAAGAALHPLQASTSRRPPYFGLRKEKRRAHFSQRACTTADTALGSTSLMSMVDTNGQNGQRAWCERGLRAAASTLTPSMSRPPVEFTARRTTAHARSVLSFRAVSSGRWTGVPHRFWRATCVSRSHHTEP